MADAAPLGFVVIGRNEGPRLASCLASLGGPDALIVYADSASRDDSVSVAEQAGASVVRIDPARPMNASRGRQEGLDRLLAEHPQIAFVQFVDGDCILDPDWADRARRFLLENPRVAAVCGRRFEAHPEASLYNQMCDDEWNTPPGQATACGGDAMMRVDALRDVNGFRPDLMAGEEPELCARLRAKDWAIWRLDRRMTEHDARILTLGQWLRRGMRGGYGFAQVWDVMRGSPHRLYGRQLASTALWAVAIPLLAILLAVAFRNALFLLICPGLIAVQTLRMALRLGAARSYSWKKAAVYMVSKFAEAWGAARYFIEGNRSRNIEYKSS